MVTQGCTGEMAASWTVRSGLMPESSLVTSAGQVGSDNDTAVTL